MSTPPPPFDPTGSAPYPGQQPPASGSPEPYPQQPGPQQPYPSAPTPAGGASGGGGYLPPPAPPVGGPGVPRFDPVESIRYGWLGFTQNVAPYLIVSLVTLVVAGGLSVAGSLIDAAGNGTFDSFDGASSGGGDLSVWSFNPASTALNSVTSMLSMIISLGMLRMSFDVVDGRKAELGRLFSGYNVGIGIVTAIVVSLLTTLGTFMCILPGLVFAFLSMFALSGVVDRDEGIGDAIKNSISLTSSNIGPVLLWMLLLFLLAVAAICTCGIGFLVVIPIFSLSTAYAYRALRGEPIAQPV